MANFYAKLKSWVNDCDTAYIEPLSYIKHFSTSTTPEKIILLYKKVSRNTIELTIHLFVLHKYANAKKTSFFF